MLPQSASYRSIHEKVETPNVLMDLFDEERMDILVYLAAQAGVRYSIENPRAYLESNINGTFELLKVARAYPPAHMLLASSSSAYGANDEMPCKETVKADLQMSFHAATKSLRTIWRIVTLICLTYLLQCFGFLPFMVRGVARKWRRSNLQK